MAESTRLELTEVEIRIKVGDADPWPGGRDPSDVLDISAAAAETVYIYHRSLGLDVPTSLPTRYADKRAAREIPRTDGKDDSGPTGWRTQDTELEGDNAGFSMEYTSTISPAFLDRAQRARAGTVFPAAGQSWG